MSFECRQKKRNQTGNRDGNLKPKKSDTLEQRIQYPETGGRGLSGVETKPEDLNTSRNPVQSKNGQARRVRL